MINQKLVNPILMWSVVVLGGAIFSIVFPDKKILPDALFTPLIVIPCAIYWVYFFVGALKVNRTAPFSAASVKTLAKTGVYSQVRHPIYSADIVLAWGVFFLHPTLKVLTIVLWLCSVLVFWMSLEEKALSEKFGSDYERYRKEVPMFIPK